MSPVIPGKDLPDSQTPQTPPATVNVEHNAGSDIWDSPPPASPPSSASHVDNGSGGGGSGGGGGGGGKDYDGPGKDYNDTDEAARFLGLAGNPEVWKDTNTEQTFIVYFVDSAEPPIPLLFEVPDDGKTLQAFFGEGNKIVIDNKVDTAELDAVGAVKFGTTNNLDASEGDPWLGFKDRMERVSKIQPWLLEPDILALVSGAFLEGRDLEPWEFQDTDWYQSNNAEQRAWIELSFGDPSTAEKKVLDDQMYTQSLFDGIGADGTDSTLTNWMSTKLTTGDWSKAYLTQQVEAVTSGWFEMDAELTTFIDEGDITVATTQDQYENIKQLWNEWLGPAFQPTDNDLQKWSTKIRNTKDGKDELVQMLKGQRMSVYSEYEDPNLSYQDIAGPWRNLAFSMWGETVDETEPMFQELIQKNDYAEAQKTLRREGMNQNIDKVWDDATKASSGNLRRAL